MKVRPDSRETMPRAISASLFVISLLVAHAAADARASEERQSDDSLCHAALQLINRGALESTFLPFANTDADDRTAFERRTGETLVGEYKIEVNGKAGQSVWLARTGGSCDANELRLPQGSSLSIDQRMVDEGADYGLQNRLARLGDEVVAVVYKADMESFTPLALGRWKNDRLTPVCAFTTSGMTREPVSTPAEPLCTAFIAGRVQKTRWEDDAAQGIPDSPMAPLAERARHAELDWSGEGRKCKTWLLSYISSAGCGEEIEWIALDRTHADPLAVDETSGLGKALLFESSEPSARPRAWMSESVFTYHGRAWLAGRPDERGAEADQWGIYGFDSKGAHLQCRYRRLPQFEIEHRSFGKDGDGTANQGQ